MGNQLPGSGTKSRSKLPRHPAGRVSQRGLGLAEGDLLHTPDTNRCSESADFGRGVLGELPRVCVCVSARVCVDIDDVRSRGQARPSTGFCLRRSALSLAVEPRFQCLRSSAPSGPLRHASANTRTARYRAARAALPPPCSGVVAMDTLQFNRDMAAVENGALFSPPFPRPLFLTGRKNTVAQRAIKELTV